METLLIFLILFSCVSIKNIKEEIVNIDKNQNFVGSVKSELGFSESYEKAGNSLTITSNNLSFGNNVVANLSGDLQANGYLILDVEYYNIQNEVAANKPYTG